MRHCSSRCSHLPPQLLLLLRLLLPLPGSGAMHFQQWWRLRPSDLNAGLTVIPTLAKSWEDQAAFQAARQRMFAAGLYPGVDYDIEEVTFCDADPLLTVRPCYPLVEKLERDDWPVTVPFSLAPRWMLPAAYNVLTACFALALAAAGLLGGVVLSSAVTLSVVPSESMTPTIMPRDVLLVEKLSPRAPPRAGSLPMSHRHAA